MKMIDEWKQAWRWFSVQAMAIAVAIQGAWLFIPEDLKAQVPPAILHWTTIALLVFGVAGRLVKQEKKE